MSLALCPQKQILDYFSCISFYLFTIHFSRDYCSPTWTTPSPISRVHRQPHFVSIDSVNSIAAPQVEGIVHSWILPASSLLCNHLRDHTKFCIVHGLGFRKEKHYLSFYLIFCVMLLKSAKKERSYCWQQAWLAQRRSICNQISHCCKSFQQLSYLSA